MKKMLKFAWSLGKEITKDIIAVIWGLLKGLGLMLLVISAMMICAWPLFKLMESYPNETMIGMTYITIAITVCMIAPFLWFGALAWIDSLRERVKQNEAMYKKKNSI